jgi:aminopeptidase N
MHDLLGSWERAGAGDLGPLTEQWLSTAGADTLTLDRPAGVIRRTAPAGSLADRSHTFRVAVGGPDGWTSEKITVAGPSTPYDAGDAPVLIDPYGDTWAVTHPDPVTVTALKSALSGLTDPLLRAGVWDTVRSGVVDATTDPADAVDLVVASFPVEDTEDIPHRSSARRTQPWVFQFLLPIAPAGSLERVHAATSGLVGSLPPGSEHQLAAYRAAIKSAIDPAVLRGWLDAVPAGLEADLDLRWRALVRLAALGGTDAAELDAELAADPSGLARVEHTRARASLPTAEAKEFAWARLTGEVSASNYETEAAGLGLWTTGQEELTAPYVDRYLAALPGLAGVHSGWVLGEVVEAFFPITVLDSALVARCWAASAEPGLDPVVRRRLRDATDRLRRMVDARAAYPS